MELSLAGGVVLGSVEVELPLAGGVSLAAGAGVSAAGAGVSAAGAGVSLAAGAGVVASAAGLSAGVSAFSFWLSQAATPSAPATAKAVKNFRIAFSPSRKNIPIAHKSRNGVIEAQPPDEIKMVAAGVLECRQREQYSIFQWELIAISQMREMRAADRPYAEQRRALSS